MEYIYELIKPELLVLIPVLYFVGTFFKSSSLINDKYIPIALGVIGIVLACLYILATGSINTVNNIFEYIFAGLTQGILCAGASVYVNQIVKQQTK